ncbi:cupin domain-containing protein [Noviherbaspirillum saxi]|uniref:ChrR-like cupin domain-containing protein n=1 Tax=Noviherbaspirillum saxi TaxID=2320863 RepID=A0A3A3FN00_9BURK|nr:cupin domain-containing protein [Noviherbaspirillum saxi]RJF95029.1 hypothetical protein D3871_16300 [Noviherbaspirillum saxi]
MAGHSKSTERPVIDADIEEAILINLSLMPLNDATRSALLERTLAATRRKDSHSKDSHSFVTVLQKDGEWREIVSGVFQKRLLENEKMHATLYRMLPGSSFPAHEHPTDEECVCLEGEVDLGGIALRAGEFHLAPQGVRHGQIRTEEGCLLYVRCAAS